jgi:hypothetical protein
MGYATYQAVFDQITHEAARSQKKNPRILRLSGKTAKDFVLEGGEPSGFSRQFSIFCTFLGFAFAFIGKGEKPVFRTAGDTPAVPQFPLLPPV